MSKRLLAILLSAVMVLGVYPYTGYGAVDYEAAENAEMPTSGEDGEFYISSPNLNMLEGSGEIYEAVIRREGEELEAASVRLLLLDISAEYGKDYTVEAGEAVVRNWEKSESLYAAFSENGGGLEEINGLDEISRLGKTDEELLEMYERDIEELSEDLSYELQSYVEEKSAETGKSGKEIIEEANEKQGSLSAAFEAATGLKDDSAPMDGGGEGANGLLNAYTTEKLPELARALDSPYIILDFAEGESEKTIEIIPIDNDAADGNRMFLANLYPESENALIGEMKGLTAVIEDDEEWEKPVIEFAEGVYYPKEGFCNITIKRSGVLTDVSAVKLMSTEGSAMEGRDYSETDTTVVFPYGISERTVKIPVRSEYVESEADFGLELSEVQNATLGAVTSARGVIEAGSASYMESKESEEVGGSGMQLMAQEARVSDVVLAPEAKALDHKNPYYIYAQKDGYARAEGDDFVIRPKGSYGRVWAGANWGARDGYVHYDYDGYQIDWTKESSLMCYTDNEIRFYSYNDDKWHTIWENRDERWSQKTNTIYPGQRGINILAIHISHDQSALGAVPTVKIHSIKPILRPFEVGFVNAEHLKFRNRDGEYVDDINMAETVGASKARLKGASEDGGGTALKYSGDSITLTTSSEYGYISGVKIVSQDGKKSKLIRSGLPSGTDSVSITLDNYFIIENLDYISFVNNGGGGRLKGQFKLQPVFDYYESNITLHADKRAAIYVNDKDRENEREGFIDGVELGELVGSYKIRSGVNKIYMLTGTYGTDSVIYKDTYNNLVNREEWGAISDFKIKNFWPTLIWDLYKLSDGTYRIYNIATDSFLTVNDERSDKSMTVTDLSSLKRQSFEIREVDGETYLYISGTDNTVNLERSWYVNWGEPSSQSRVEFEEASAPEIESAWKLAEEYKLIKEEEKKDDFYSNLPKGIYRIRSYNGGYFTKKDDGSIGTVYWNAEAGIEWIFTPMGADLYKLTDAKTGYALTVEGGSAEDDARMILAPDNNTDSQRFYIKPYAGAYYSLYTKSSNGEKHVWETLPDHTVVQSYVRNGSGDIGAALAFEYIRENENYESEDITKDRTVKAHKGDWLSFTQIINTEYKSRYNSSHIRFVKKVNSDSEELEDNSKYNSGKCSYDLHNKFSDIDVYVLLDQKINQVIVRVPKSSRSLFDQSIGIFNCEYVDAGQYRDYIVRDSDEFALNSYVEMEAMPISDSYVTVWEVPNPGRRYTQTSFYFETREDYGDNIIMLSCEKADERKYQLTGTAHYSEISLATKNEGASFRPAAGLSVSFGRAAIGISIEDGSFSTYPANGIKGSYVKYKVEGMGRINYREALLYDTLPKDTDDGSGGKLTVSNIPVGDIKCSVLDMDAPHVSSFVATNENGALGDNVVQISNDDNSKASHLIATITNNGASYTDAAGTDRTERIKKVEFVIYDYRTNTVKSVLEGASEIQNQGSMSVWQLNKYFVKSGSNLYAASDRIYARVTTDRVKGTGKAYNEKGELVEMDSLMETVYPDVYTGYTFYEANAEIPNTQDIGFLDGNFDKFLTLPVLGSMNSTFGIKNMALSISQLPEGGFRLGLGYTGKESREADDKEDHSIPLTPDNIKSEFKKAGDWGRLMGNPKGAFGLNAGGIYPIFGIYLDFGLKENQHLDPTSTPETDLVFLGGGAMIGAIGDYRIVIYGAIGPVPVYFGVDGSLAAFANIGIKLKSEKTLSDGSIQYKDVSYRGIKSGDEQIEDEVLFDFALNMHGVLNVYVGAGIAGTFGVRGGASIGASAIYYPTIIELYDINPLGFKITVDLKFWVDIVLFSVPAPFLNLADESYGYYKDIAELRKDNPSILSLASASEGPETDEYGAFLRRGSGEDEEWLPEGSGMSLMSTFEKEKETVLSKNGYEQASPKLIDIGGGRVLLVFLASDNDKGAYDRTSVSFSVYTNGRWTLPVKIDTSSEKGDFEPDVCDIGDKVLVSWISRDDDDDSTNPADYLKGMNVYAAEIDKKSLAVSKAAKLSDDEYYNSHPVGLYDEETGDYMVYYLKAEVADSDIAENEYENSVRDSEGAKLLTIASPTTNGAKLMYRLHHDGEWVSDSLSSNESVLQASGERFVVSSIDDVSGANSNSPRIIDFDALSYDGKGIYAYTIDLDNNIDTMGDRELYIQFYSFSEYKNYAPIRITNNNLSDLEPQLVRNGEHSFLFWREGENTIKYIDLSDLVTRGINEDGTFKTLSGTVEGETLERDYEIKPSVIFSSMEDPEMAPSFANYRVFVDNEGNMFIAWTQGESATGEDGNIRSTALEVYASAFISEEDTEGAMLDASWSDGMPLTRSGRNNDGIAVWADGNGKLITVNNQYDIDESDPEAKNIKLISTEYKTVGSAEISAVHYYDTTPMAGSTDSVTIDVKNRGLKAVNGFTLKAYEKLNGTVSAEPVYEITSEERITPSSITPVSFEWQMPESYEGIESLALHITVQETGYEELHEFDSESIEFKAEFEIRNAEAFQEMWGVNVRYEIANVGNIDFNSDDYLDDEGNYTGDRVVMEFVDTYDTGSKALTLLDEPVVYSSVIKAGESILDFWPLDIPEEGYFKYGRLNSTLTVKSKDGETLFRAPDVHIALEYPRYIYMDEELPVYVLPGTVWLDLKPGESYELGGSEYSDADYFKNGKVKFVSTDPSVFTVVDNKITAVGEGRAYLNGEVEPFGGSLSVYVRVEEASEDPEDEPSKPSSGGSGKSGSGGSATVVVIPDKEAEAEESQTGEDNESEKEELNEDELEAAVRSLIDLDTSEWYMDAINYVLKKGIMNGVGKNRFEPGGNASRSQIAMILWRLMGEPESEGSVSFKDFDENEWYAPAIRWASVSGVVNGYTNGLFGPNDAVRRQDLALMLYRFGKVEGREEAEPAESKGSLESFSDSAEVEAYAKEAMEWAVASGLMNGKGKGRIEPNANATRAEIATMIMRYLEERTVEQELAA